MPVPGPGFPWKRAGLLVLTVAAAGTLVWTGQFYQTHAMPNVRVAGVPAGLASRAEVERAVGDAASRLSVVFKAAGKTTAPPLERIGVQIDQNATVNAAFGARRLEDMPSSLALWKAQNVPLVLAVDQQKLEEYIEVTFPEVYRPPKEPDLSYRPASGQFELIPGESGQGFDIAAIARVIKSRSANPGTVTISASQQPVPPGVSDAAAVYTQDQANQRLWLRLEFLYQQELIYYPEPSEIAAWMEFVPDEQNAELDIRYSRARMNEFLRGPVESNLNRFFGPQSDGSNSSETPLQLTNPEALMADMLYALRAKDSLSKEVEARAVAEPAQFTL